MLLTAGPLFYTLALIDAMLTGTRFSREGSGQTALYDSPLYSFVRQLARASAAIPRGILVPPRPAPPAG